MGPTTDRLLTRSLSHSTHPRSRIPSLRRIATTATSSLHPSQSRPITRMHAKTEIAPLRGSAVSQYLSRSLGLIALCLQLFLPSLYLSQRAKMSWEKEVELTTEAMITFLHDGAPRRGLIRKPVIRHVYLLSSIVLTLALLPLWTVRYAHPSWRPRRSWTLGTALRVRSKRGICALVGALEIDTLGRDLSVDMDHKDLRFSHPITLPPASESLLRGHPAEMLATLQESAAKGFWAPHFVHRPVKADPLSWKANWLAQDSTEYGPAPVKAFWYAGEKPSPDTPLPPLRPGEPIGLYFHGGGYLCGTAAETDTCANIPRRIVEGSHIKRILSVDYRLAPQGPWPLPLIDAISSYAYLLSLGVKASEIVIIGDSAGGHLAMALTRWLRDDGKDVGMGMPKGLVLMSPWCDLGFTNAWGEGRSHNAYSDIIDDTFGPFACGLLMRALPVDILYESPYLSPASHLISSSTTGATSLADFPPTCIIYGGAERLSQSINQLWSRLQLARMPDTAGQAGDMLFEGKDCVHDFMIFPWQEKGAAIAHAQLDEWFGTLFSGDNAMEPVHRELDMENSPVLAPSWSSLAESMDQNLSLGSAALDDGASELSTVGRDTNPIPCQAGNLAKLPLRYRSPASLMSLRAVESDEETLVDDGGDDHHSEGSVDTLSEITGALGKGDTRLRAC